MQNYFNSNIALLQRHHPQAAAVVAGLPAAPYGEIIETATGRPTLRVTHDHGEEVFVHLPGNPEAEVPQFLALVPEHSSEVVILLGMGLGYTPLALIQQRPDISQLIIFELDPQLFRQALHHLDLAPLLSNPRVVLSISSQPDVAGTLAAAHHALQYENISFLKHLPSVSLQEAAYLRLEETIYTLANEIASMGATKSRHGETIMANRFNNLSAIRHHHLLENLKGVFKDIPAFIVAAGPSLDKNIHLLREAHDKAVIITVDSSLPSLLFHGIQPHFISAIDFSKFTFEKIATAGLQAQGAALLCSYWVGPNAPKRFPAANVFWAATTHPLERWIHQLLGGTETTSSIGTVAHLNLIGAITMGCSPIVFVGQDLSYPPPSGQGSHVDHARHCYFGNTEEMKSKKAPVWVEGIDGAMRPTLRDFLVYKKIFEEIIHANPGHYINATAEGAHLQGTEVLPLAEVIHTFCVRHQPIAQILRERLRRTSPPDVPSLMTAGHETIRQINSVQKKLKECIHLATTFRNDCLRLRRQGHGITAFEQLPSAIRHRAATLDTLRGAIDGAGDLWQFVDELTVPGFRDNARKAHAGKQLQENPKTYIPFLLHNSELILHTANTRRQALFVFAKHLGQTLNLLDEEGKRLSAVERGERRTEELLRLAQHYFETNALCLAKPLLAEIGVKGVHGLEVNYTLACIAAYQADHHLANTLFSRVEEEDAGYKHRIAKFRRQYGDEYQQISEEFKKEVGQPSKQMLLRGLGLCPQHPGISRELREMARTDVETINQAVLLQQPEKAQPIISAWHEDLLHHEQLTPCLGAEDAALFLRYQGERMSRAQHYQQAEEAIKAAAVLTPDNPANAIALMNLCFLQLDFQGGVTHLRHAVALDNGYAPLWEEIGDHLRQAGHHQEALVAYEQAFLAFPGNWAALKKIGDCHAACGQLEAAKEAFEQVKMKMGAPVCPTS